MLTGGPRYGNGYGYGGRVVPGNGYGGRVVPGNGYGGRVIAWRMGFSASRAVLSPAIRGTRGPR